MKKCPYCSEEIQVTAVKCRYCGEWLEKAEPSLNKDGSNDRSITSLELPPQQIEVSTPEIKTDDEAFISLLKSKVKENRLDTIVNYELVELCNQAKKIYASKSIMDVGLKDTINVLSEEISKRGLPPEYTSPRPSPQQSKIIQPPIEKETIFKKLLWAVGIFAILIVAAIGGGIGKQAGRALVEPGKPTQQEVDAKLIEGFEKVVQQLNQKLPIMVDENTRMDKATIGPGPRATYHYTFPKYSSRDIDLLWLQQNLKPIVRNNVCNNKDMQLSMQYGAIYQYSYSGGDGILIGSFEFDRNDCGFTQLIPNN